MKALIILLSVLVLAGCTNTLRVADSLDEPVSVVLVDHGRHPSLILPDGEGGGARYTWGEWRWYAKNDTGVLRAAHAFLWPTQSTLGRYRFDEWPAGAARWQLIPEGYRTWFPIEVEKVKAEALRERLDGIFEEAAEDAVYNPVYRLEFVPLEGRYWVFNQSNQRMIDWLRELDVEVRGPGIYSNWRVAGDDA